MRAGPTSPRHRRFMMTFADLGVPVHLFGGGGHISFRTGHAHLPVTPQRAALSSRSSNTHPTNRLPSLMSLVRRMESLPLGDDGEGSRQRQDAPVPSIQRTYRRFPPKGRSG